MNTVTVPRLLKQSAFLFSLVGLSLALVACGGDDDKKSTSSSSSSSHVFIPTPTTPPLSETWPNVKISANGTKTLKFEWLASSVPVGTSYYKLMKKADATSVAYEQVGTNLNGTLDSVTSIISVTDAVSVHLADWVNSRYKVLACNEVDPCAESSEIVINSAMLTAITYVKASNAEADDWFGWSMAISGDGKTLAVGAPGEDSKATGVNGAEDLNESPNSGAVYVFIKNASGVWQQQAYLKASNTEQPNVAPNLTQLPNDRFGYNVALSTDGNTLAVSAIHEDSTANGVISASREDSNCFQQDFEYTTASFASNSSRTAVLRHLSGDFGAVYIFKRTDTVWAQSTYIKAMHFAPGSQFGLALAVSGDGKTLAVGTPLDKTNIAGVQNTSTSSTECFNTASDFSSSSSTSSSPAAISSNATISISNSSGAAPGGNHSGAVHVYRESDTGGWGQEAFVKAPDAKPDSAFGVSIALSFDGSTMVVGADSDYVNSEGLVQTFQKDELKYSYRSGAAYVYLRTDQTYTFQQKLKASPNLVNLRFGASVAVSGDGKTISVGAPGSADPSNGINPTINETEINNSYFDALIANKLKTDYGSTYIFVHSGATWVQQSYIKASNSKPDYEFGSCTALSYNGSVLAVGSMFESSVAKGINGDELDTSAPIAGAAYVFSLTGNTWTQKSYVKAPNSEANDRFGHAIGLDASGETLMIGAHRESSNAKGVNGNKENGDAAASGAVYLY